MRRGRRGDRAGGLRPRRGGDAGADPHAARRPTPAGMEELPPELVPPPDNADDDCDLTASLRPFPDRAQADDAVANDQGPRPAHRRTRHRQQPVQLPRPDHRRDHRIRRRHRRRGGPRHLRHPVAGRVPHPVVGRSHHRTAEQPGRHRRQDHEHHVRAQEAGQLLDGVSDGQPTDPGAARLDDLAGERPVGQAGLRGQGHHVAAADPGDQPVADRRRGGDVGRLPGCAAAASGRRGQHRRLHPCRAGGPGPVSAHRRAEHERGALRHRHQPGRTPAWCASSTARWIASAATARGTRCTANG